MTFRHWPSRVCPDCGGTCGKDAAVDAYNATVIGTDGWGSADTNVRYKAMTEAVRTCHLNQKTPTENPLTELSRRAMKWSGVDRDAR